MNRISIIAIILLICSCGTSKKITQTETHSKVNIESSYLDTSKRSESWEMIVNSVVKEIDLSKIHITTYYPIKDSTGKQLVKEVVLIDQNFTTSDSKYVKEVKRSEDMKAVVINSTLSRKSDSSYTYITERKNKSLKIYLILSSIIGLVFLLAWKRIFKIQK